MRLRQPTRGCWLPLACSRQPQPLSRSRRVNGAEVVTPSGAALAATIAIPKRKVVSWSMRAGPESGANQESSLTRQSGNQALMDESVEDDSGPGAAAVDTTANTYHTPAAAPPPPPGCVLSAVVATSTSDADASETPAQHGASDGDGGCHENGGDVGDERRERQQRSRFAEGRRDRRSRSRSRSRSAERRHSRERYQHQRRDHDYRGGASRTFGHRQRQPAAAPPRQRRWEAADRPADREVSRWDGRRTAVRAPDSAARPMRREPVRQASRPWDDRPRDDGRRAAHAPPARPETHPARPPAAATRPLERRSKPMHPLDPQQESWADRGAAEQRRRGSVDSVARWERGVERAEPAIDAKREARRRAFASFEF